MNQREHKLDALSDQIDRIVLACDSYRPDGTFTNAARDRLVGLSRQMDEVFAEGRRPCSMCAVVNSAPSNARTGDPTRWKRRNRQH